MRLLPITSCLLLLALSLSAQVAQLRWDVQVDRPVPHDFPVWQGETVDLMPRLVQGTAPVAVTNAPVEFRYREAALATNVYRYVTADPNTNTGVLAVRWIPDYDAGAAWYDYQIIVGSNAANPRAFGRITMRPTIGWQASTSPPPAILQYATTTEMQAASNALAEALQPIGPRLDLIEGRTNYWDLAYFWGDHAAAGYLASSLWLSWLATNTYVKAERDLAALRIYHYGSPDIVESPTNWFEFDSGTITGFNWEAGRTNVVIPWAIGGVPVTAIGTEAFKMSGIVSVIAPQTVTVIRVGAFSGCSSLTSINLPQVTVIGVGAFSDCAALASVNLPQVTSIRVGAFSDCSSLTSIGLPQVTSIGNYAFAGCTSLTAVHIGQNAPAEATSVFASITPPPNVYVTDPQATGWGAVWNGKPVVRQPLYGDEIYQAGELVATEAHVAQVTAGATNALVQTYLLTTNAWMSVSNSVLSVTVVTNGVTNVVWSSAESAGGLDPSFSNAVVSAITDLTSSLAGKAPLAWGQYAPDGSANPDPDYMLFLNSPATWFAGGCSWISSGAYAALSTSGTVAFEACGDGQFRIGPNSTNWFGYVQGGSVLVGAAADSLSVTEGGTSNGYVEIVYPYVSGDFPALWFTPQLNLDFALLEANSVAWADNLDGSATVTAPATTAAGFWYATTTATFDNFFQSTMPARFSGGVLGSTNAAPVVYDSVITISSGGKSYRLPAQEVQ